MEGKINKQFIRQLIIYGIIGGLGALVDFALFTLFFKVWGLNEYVANIISIHAGIALSFVLNRKYNFKKTDKLLKRALLFYITGLFGLGLSQLILWLGGSILSLPVLWVKLFSIFLVAMVQFFINKFITFKN